MSSTPMVAVSYPAVVGAILLAKRKEIGLSQAEMADAVGLNVSTWSRVENGDSAMTIEQLASAASALNVLPSSVLKATEVKLEELKTKGIATGANRADLASIAALGAIPIAGTALLGVLGPIGALAAGVASAYFYATRKARDE